MGMVQSVFRRFMNRMNNRNNNNFESALIIVGMGIVLLEFFTLNANISVCGGQGCFPIWVHIIVILIGIAMAGWGVMLLNPPRDSEWLVDWEE
jgi:hypothetical protein